MNGKLISVTFEYKGEVITLGGDGTQVHAPDPESVEYAADGWSVETRHGCVRNKLVDEYLNQMAVGDEIQQQQAAMADRWFAVFVAGRDYDDETKTLLIRNYHQDNEGPTFASGYTGKMMLEQFYPDVQRDMSDTKPPFTYIYGEALAGYKTPIFGFNMYNVHKVFAERHLASLAQGLQAMRNYNPNAPTAEDLYR